MLRRELYLRRLRKKFVPRLTKRDDVMEWNFLKISPPKWRTGCAPVSRQCWKRRFRLGFFATEDKTNLRHTLGRKTWLDRHFRDTTASSCFYTWGIAAGKQASGGCDQSTKFAQFCTEMHVFNRCFSYATHFWYNPACFKTAAIERIGYICSDWAHW